MIGRRQLAVASPISIGAVAKAFARSIGNGEELRRHAASLIAREFTARHVVLLNSGTSALVAALRLAVRRGGTVAFPGYACVDLAAAAQLAGVRVRLYDVDPRTLSPDLGSVERVLERGIDAIVVAHLFGFPADVPGVRALVASRGVPVIEDAAQGAAGTLGGRRLGTFGDLAVLSFGRGKGLCAGGGGALLAHDEVWSSRLEGLTFETSGRGWLSLAKTGIQWALGRPALYAVPSAVPWLRLGEMVYHPAVEPAQLAAGASALIESALELEPADLARRRENARAYDDLIDAASGISRPRPLAGSDPGYLRYPVLDLGARSPAPELGVLRSYPATLAEQPELAPILLPSEPPVPGSARLRESLFTLPTHGLVAAADRAGIARWLGVDSGSGPRAEPDVAARADPGLTDFGSKT